MLSIRLERLQLFLGLVHGSVFQQLEEQVPFVLLHVLWLPQSTHAMHGLGPAQSPDTEKPLSLRQAASGEHPWPSMSPCCSSEPFRFPVPRDQHKPAYNSLDLNLKIWRGKQLVYKGVGGRASIW